ncbi:MAG TPA: hypothetical protein VF627_12575 [Abditibacterium sp.]|jgi:uncharacterized lipoprotein
MNTIKFAIITVSASLLACLAGCSQDEGANIYVDNKASGASSAATADTMAPSGSDSISGGVAAPQTLGSAKKKAQ